MDCLSVGFSPLETLVGTVTLRPYVFGFIVAYLLVAVRDLGWRQAGSFAGWTFAAAWAAEFASTRIGVPFGLYHYTGATQDQELFLSNVPLFDSMSFVFLAYAAYCLARLALRRAQGLGVVALASVAMMLLDVVIDPLAVRGDRWFLGRIFYYPDGGPVFGVPLSNFAGWVFFGWLAIGGFDLAFGARRRGSPVGGAVLYYGLLAFNLGIAWSIGAGGVLALGLLLHSSFVFALTRLNRAVDGRAASAAPALTTGGLQPRAW